ncbi:hypothetical protein OH76DRAFT_1397427 [Lentinus brumalis]|uniref:Uncharacterized protein n=1 Tax=Lentinus brumalis TaxID=2498619 RepID=A0A371DRH5_9APHY|nr:hypothetical protein OH76DRAFT_1397427 [Polyporus brumalis]
MPQHDGPYSFGDLQAATEAIDTLLNSGISDHALHARAREALDVLNLEAAAPCNKPPYLEQFADSWPPSPAFTVKSLFESMLDVTEDLGLKQGFRYTSAAICVFSDAAHPVNEGVERA